MSASRNAPFWIRLHVSGRLCFCKPVITVKSVVKVSTSHISLGTTTAMATKTSLKKWIRAASNFIALIPSRAILQMLAIFSGVELLLKLPIIFYARLSIMGAHNWCLKMRFWFVISHQYEDRRGKGVFYLKECRQFVNWCWQAKNLPHPILPLCSCYILYFANRDL